MVFDADAYSAAIEAPSVQLNNKTYTGRILSMEQFIPFSTRFDRLIAGQLSPLEESTLYREYLRMLFPKKLYYKWRGDPVDLLMKSPALTSTMIHFFVCQLHALNPSLKLPETNGMN